MLNVQVPLGILLKSENKGDNMVDIMLYHHQYFHLISLPEVCVLLMMNKKLKFLKLQLVAITSLLAELEGPKWARGNSVVHLHGLEPTASNFPTQKY